MSSFTNSNTHTSNSYYSSNNTTNDNIGKIASEGIQLFTSIIKSAEPIVNNFGQKIEDIEKEINKSFNSNKNNKNNKNNENNIDKNKKSLNYHVNDTLKNIYIAVEIPGMSHEDCSIKTKDDTLIVEGRKPSHKNFEFVGNTNHELVIKFNSIDKSLVKSQINVDYKFGVLYITVKKISRTENIDINNLD